VAEERDRWLHERAHWAAGRTVAGLDEVGTGAWAGPVVAGCVVLPPEADAGREPTWHEIDDSKRLSAAKRARLDAWIRARCPAVGLGWVEVAELEAMNVLRAGLLAMERALAAATAMGPIDHLLVDARRLPHHRGAQTALVRGDRRSVSIGAASIVAKVARDAFMTRAEDELPGYDFARHKGYGTAAHREALARLGPSRLHRPSFLPREPVQLTLL
jgi:ribonuclease HII